MTNTPLDAYVSSTRPVPSGRRSWADVKCATQGRRVPVTVLTHLGGGKTTLLSHMLTPEHGRRSRSSRVSLVRSAMTSS